MNTHRGCSCSTSRQNHSSHDTNCIVNIREDVTWKKNAMHSILSSDMYAILQVILYVYVSVTYEPGVAQGQTSWSVVKFQYSGNIQYFHEASN